MRDLASPFGGFSPLGGRSANYLANAAAPAMVADIADDYYEYNGGPLNSLLDLIDYSTSTPRTLYDASGVLKWGSMDLTDGTATTQSISTIVGETYKIHMGGAGSVALSGAGSGTVTEGNPVEIVATTTTLTLTVSGAVDHLWAYINSLGGMADVPPAHRGLLDEPTYLANDTGAARFLPRTMGHREVDGMWVPQLTVDKAAATNEITNPMMQGAVVGMVGAGGALPTGWASSSFDSVEVVDIGAFRGAAAIRIKATRDNTGGGGPVYPFLSLASPVVFTPAAPYTYHLWHWDGDDMSAIAPFQQFFDGVGNKAQALPSAAAPHYAVFTSDANAGATTGLVRIANTVNAGDLGVLDLWIALPQFEKSAEPSSFIPSYGAARTRTAETFTQRADRPVWPSGAAGSRALAVVMRGVVTYADNGATDTVALMRHEVDANNKLEIVLNTDGAKTGEIMARLVVGGVTHTAVSAADAYAAGISVPVNIAVRFLDGALQVATDGVAGAANTSAGNLPDLSAADIEWFPAQGGGADHVAVFTEDAANRLDNANGPNTLTEATGGNWP